MSLTRRFAASYLGRTDRTGTRNGRGKTGSPGNAAVVIGPSEERGQRGALSCRGARSRGAATDGGGVPVGTMDFVGPHAHSRRAKRAWPRGMGAAKPAAQGMRPWFLDRARSEVSAWGWGPCALIYVPDFVRSRRTSLATAFSVSKTPAPFDALAIASNTGSSLITSCFFISSTGTTLGKSRLLSWRT